MRRRSSTSIPAGVARFIRRLDLLPGGSRVAPAVSGGSDSVALVRVLQQLAPDLGIRLAGVIHVNHQLRGLESDRDEQFCRELAAGVGLPIHVERVSVARGPRRSPEDAARQARYDALERGRLALGGDVVALGHTSDDQAETVLLRLLRGSGPDGLSGIPPRRGVFVRPLLETRREDLRNWLGTLGQHWVEDTTNLDPRVPRNAIRQHVLPAIEAHAPHVRAVLARHAAIARDEAEWLAGLVTPVVTQLVQIDEAAVTILGGVAGEPVALQRRIVLHALRVAGMRLPGMNAVEAVRLLLNGTGSARLLPGDLAANRIGADVVLSKRDRDRADEVPDYRYSLQVPGTVAVPEADLVVVVAPGENRGRAAAGSVEVDVDGAALGPSIVVRNWRPGDSIRPAGLGGRKKLQDVFVDRKVPRPLRRRLPLVADAEDRVVWVPGLAVDERVRVTARTKAVVVLRLTTEHAQQVGGPE